jgi:hypothetical protein
MLSVPVGTTFSRGQILLALQMDFKKETRAS